MKALTMFAFAAALLLLLAFSSFAQQPARPAAPALRWQTIDNGSGQLAGGGYRLRDSVGQPAVDVLEGGAYRLSSGFWRPRGGQSLYLPMIQQQE